MTGRHGVSEYHYLCLAGHRDLVAGYDAAWVDHSWVLAYHDGVLADHDDVLVHNLECIEA